MRQVLLLMAFAATCIFVALSCRYQDPARMAFALLGLTTVAVAIRRLAAVLVADDEAP